MIRVISVAMALLVASCGSTDKPFVPKSDYGLPPDPRAFVAPEDCEGGSRLAALDLKEPEYPRKAYARGQQGWVAVRLDVDATGKTRNVKAIAAEPTDAFRGAARNAVRQWRFEPPGGEGISRCVVILDFRLGRGRIGF